MSECICGNQIFHAADCPRRAAPTPQTTPPDLVRIGKLVDAYVTAAVRCGFARLDDPAQKPAAAARAALLSAIAQAVADAERRAEEAEARLVAAAKVSPMCAENIALRRRAEEAERALETMKDRDYEPVKAWIREHAPEAARHAYRIMEAAESCAASLASRVEALEGALRGLVSDIDALISDSNGVAGLHRNGDLATWDWLTDGEWLSALAPARAALSAPAPDAAREDGDWSHRCPECGASVCSHVVLMARRAAREDGAGRPLPHPDDAGAPCGACKGRGWVPSDDVPRAVCGTCDGTGYPDSWAAREIARLDAEVHRLRAPEPAPGAAPVTCVACDAPAPADVERPPRGHHWVCLACRAPAPGEEGR